MSSRANHRSDHQFNAAILALWIIVTLSALLFHEPWRDELQSWLLTRDLSWTELWGQMSYEGHFLPWYLLVKILHTFNLPILSQNFLSWTLVLFAVIQVLYYSPFPRILKMAVIFSAPLLYWFPVVSRCYALIPILLFTIAIYHKDRFKYPIRYGAATALLANTHLYMEGFVLVVFLMSCHDYWKEPNRANRLAALKTASCMILGVLIAFLTVVPAITVSDNEFKPFSLFTPQRFFMELYSYANGNLLPNFMDTTLFSPQQGTVLAIVFTIAALYFFRTNNRRALYGVLAAMAIGLCICFNFYKFSLVAVFLLSPILLLKKQYTWLLTAMAVMWGYQWLFAVFLYMFLPQRAVLTLLLLVFFCWILSDTTFKQKVKREKTESWNDLQKYIVFYACFTFFGVANLLLCDYRTEFSGTSKGGKFLQNQFGKDAVVAIASCDDRLTGIAAYTTQKLYDLQNQRQITFHPRNQPDRVDEKPLPDFDVLVYGQSGMPPDLHYQGIALKKVAEINNCIVRDEVMTFYVPQKEKSPAR